MYVSKVLKRKDASSLIIAVTMGVAFAFFLAAISNQPAAKLSGVEYAGSLGWKESILVPLLTLVIELVVLEISLRLLVLLRPIFVRKAK